MILVKLYYLVKVKSNISHLFPLHRRYSVLLKKDVKNRMEMKIDLRKVQDFQLNPIPRSDWTRTKTPDHYATSHLCHTLPLGLCISVTYLMSKCQAVNCPPPWPVSPGGLGSRLVCCSCFSSGSQYWSSSHWAAASLDCLLSL